MILVYVENGKEVKIGDAVWIRGKSFRIHYFAKPHSPASEGKVTVKRSGHGFTDTMEYYVSVIGAKWINREDREEVVA